MKRSPCLPGSLKKRSLAVPPLSIPKVQKQAQATDRKKPAKFMKNTII